MINEIKYFGFYCDAENIKTENRYSSPAANTKMEYICNVLNKMGYKVFFISMCETTGENTFKRKIVNLDESNRLLLFKTIGRKNLVCLISRKILMYIQIFCFFIINVKKGETVIIYHSMKTMKLFSLLKKLKKIKVVYEVEELYSDVGENINRYKKEKESKCIKSYDSFIFSTKNIANKININKPYIICCGVYKMSILEAMPYNDNKIHVVYAGTFEKEKGGALNAINSFMLLNEKYVLHVLGTGSKNEINTILNQIKLINNKKGYNQIIYEGVLTGSSFTRFLQKCDIGLSTQSTNLRLNDTSFPSKILSYLCNGLNVISTDIEVVRNSPVSNHVLFCNSNKPEDIAFSIMNTKEKNLQKIKMHLNRLDTEFQENLSELLKCIERF